MGNLRKLYSSKSFLVYEQKKNKPRISAKNENIQPEPKLTGFYKKNNYILSLGKAI